MGWGQSESRANRGIGQQHGEPKNNNPLMHLTEAQLGAGTGETRYVVAPERVWAALAETTTDLAALQGWYEVGNPAAVKLYNDMEAKLAKGQAHQ